HRGDQTVHGGDVDDAAVPAGLHARQGAADGMEGGRKVDGDDGVPLLDRERLHARHVLDAGVVDQDVDAPEARLGGGHQGLDLVGTAEVGVMEVHLAAMHGDLCARLGDLVRCAQAVEHDAAAGLRQALGDRQADATGGSGNEGDLVLEHGNLRNLTGTII